MKNDEIKEILEALKPHDEEFTKAGIKEYPLYLSRKQQDLLLDYITNLQEENRQTKLLKERYQLEKEIYKSRNEKANASLDEMLERAYIDGEYIMYDYSTSELLELKQALEGEDKQ